MISNPLDNWDSGSTVAIPNDPSNGGRALLLLAIRGVIELNPDAGLTPGVTDISRNPKELRFIELDAAQLPRSLDDVDAAAINTNYAHEADLSPHNGCDYARTHAVPMPTSSWCKPRIKMQTGSGISWGPIKTPIFALSSAPNSRGQSSAF